MKALTLKIQFSFLVFVLLFLFSACEYAKGQEKKDNDFTSTPLIISTNQSDVMDEAESLEYINDDMIEYGQLLVQIGGCNNCHTPKVRTANGLIPDENKLLSGHPADEKLPLIDPNLLNQDNWVLTHPMLTAFVGPWGVTYASNLTPDKTGLADWNKDQFINALRSGMHMNDENGRQIMPPMPWFNLKETSDTDLEAIWLYLQSIPPVSNSVPKHITMSNLKNHSEMLKRN